MLDLRLNSLHLHIGGKYIFGSYSLIKKRLSLPPSEGLFVESSVLALPALAYLGYLNATGDAEFGRVSAVHTTLMVLAGVATAVPLLLFAASANRVPLVGLGILQYVAPILQLACGVLIFHEPMPAARLAGFGLVWIALIIFTIDGIRGGRVVAGKRTAADPAAATAEPAAALPPR